MRVGCLPRVAELGDGLLLAVGYEDRVVAEPTVATWAWCDRSLERALDDELLSLGPDRDDHADVPGTPIRRAGELLEQAGDTVPRPPGRCEPGPASEAGRLDARVLADHPRAGRSAGAAVHRLATRVLGVGRPRLRRECPIVDQVDLPAGQGAPQLGELVRVAGGEPCPHSRGASAAARCACASCSIPPAARSSSSSSSSRVNGSRSAVAWTSTSRPSAVITTFMSVSACESSG